MSSSVAAGFVVVPRIISMAIPRDVRCGLGSVVLHRPLRAFWHLQGRWSPRKGASGWPSNCDRRKQLGTYWARTYPRDPKTSSTYNKAGGAILGLNLYQQTLPDNV